MAYTIRRSNAADGDRLVEIWRSSVAATHDFVSRSDLVAIDAEVERSLPASPVLLALDSAAQPVAFMGLTGHAIDSLFVAGDRQGQGAGRFLVDHAKRGAAFLETIVNEQNKKALGFYRHLGFVVASRSPDDGEGRPYPVLHMRWAR